MKYCECCGSPLDNVEPETREFGDLVAREFRQVLTCGEASVKLYPKTMKVLLALMRRKHLNVETLMVMFFPDAESSDALSQHILFIRKALRKLGSRVTLEISIGRSSETVMNYSTYRLEDPEQEKVQGTPKLSPLDEDQRAETFMGQDGRVFPKTYDY